MYKVTWEIEVDAKDVVHAAEVAREIQLDPDSMATFFTVEKDGDIAGIDLADVERLDREMEYQGREKTNN